MFRYDSISRNRLRKQLSWTNQIIGIYVGKFGGLYYEREAFMLFKRCFRSFSQFRLIILSPQEHEGVKEKFQEVELGSDQVLIATVSQNQVPDYLSAADFAFATYKPGAFKRFLSPVKIGEYWANGLPVLLTEGVGDDSDIIKNEGGGALFNLNEEGSVERALKKIQEILKDPAHRQDIPKLAEKYRSPDRIREAYEYFFDQQREGQS
ncbi:MAG: glycosyltransferase [Hymenobacteraceae bacterium]|nr:glycosyltransferase [Hymenobacteraceae bacterium]